MTFCWGAGCFTQCKSLENIGLQIISSQMPKCHVIKNFSKKWSRKMDIFKKLRGLNAAVVSYKKKSVFIINVVQNSSLHFVTPVFLLS